MTSPHFLWGRVQNKCNTISGGLIQEMSISPMNDLFKGSPLSGGWGYPNVNR